MTQEWHGQSEQGQSWFSDEALRKQAEIQRRKEAGEDVPAELFYGVWEPRVLPEEDEMCACCGLDARVQVGGEIHNERHWCAICVDRKHHIE
jgi:hypothetical protein